MLNVFLFYCLLALGYTSFLAFINECVTMPKWLKGILLTSECVVLAFIFIVPFAVKPTVTQITRTVKAPFQIEALNVSDYAIRDGQVLEKTKDYHGDKTIEDIGSGTLTYSYGGKKIATPIETITFDRKSGQVGDLTVVEKTYHYPLISDTRAVVTVHMK
jgi:hypothetical protein